MKYLSITGLLLALSLATASQPDISRLSWPSVALRMPDSWYGSEESVRVAENILLYQRESGGWPKNIEKHLPLSAEEKKRIIGEKNNHDAIFDNSATTTELRFLARMYSSLPKHEYKAAFNKGLKFILDAQYANGGWPMFWPLRKGYYTRITFNDNAIVNILRLLGDINTNKGHFSAITDRNLAERSLVAFNKGIDCILKTQIVVNGQPAVWCAQHDEFTLKPSGARTYELPSFSGAESVGIVLLLMTIPDPSPGIIRAVEGAVAWFDKHRIKNTRWDYFSNNEGKKDRRIVYDPAAADMWARFYDLETGEPFVCDRDGIKKKTLEEIGYERRNGYSWYTDAPSEIFKKYNAWKTNLLKNEN